MKTTNEMKLLNLRPTHNINAIDKNASLSLFFKKRAEFLNFMVP